MKAWKMGIEKRWFAHSAVKTVSHSQHYTEEPVTAIKCPQPPKMREQTGEQ